MHDFDSNMRMMNGRNSYSSKASFRLQSAGHIGKVCAQQSACTHVKSQRAVYTVVILGGCSDKMTSENLPFIYFCKRVSLLLFLYNTKNGKNLPFHLKSHHAFGTFHVEYFHSMHPPKMCRTD